MIFGIGSIQLGFLIPFLLVGMTIAVYWSTTILLIFVGMLIYSSIFMILQTGISIPISQFTFSQSKFEGNFRYAHARIRNYAESIAFYNGEEQEIANIETQFHSVLKNQLKLTRFQALQTGNLRFPPKSHFE